MDYWRSEAAWENLLGLMELPTYPMDAVSLEIEEDKTGSENKSDQLIEVMITSSGEALKNNEKVEEEDRE